MYKPTNTTIDGKHDKKICILLSFHVPDGIIFNYINKLYYIKIHSGYKQTT